MTDASASDDAVLVALDAVRQAIESNTRMSTVVIDRVNDVQRRRRAGQNYRDIIRAEERPLMVELLRENLERLLDAGSALRRAQAVALHEEGLTMDQIAELFGVSRQRVSALIRDARRRNGA
jgi:DNA-directed RNA polymerase specialized sigma24 family protein